MRGASCRYIISERELKTSWSVHQQWQLPVADRGCLSKRTDYVAKWIWSDRDVIQEGSSLRSQPGPERDARRLIPLHAGDCGRAAATSWISASCYRPLFLYRPIDSEHHWRAKGGFACMGAGHCTQAVQGPKPAGGELALLHSLRDKISMGLTGASWCCWRGPPVPRDELIAVEQAGCRLLPSLPWNSSSPNRASQKNLAVSTLVK